MLSIPKQAKEFEPSLQMQAVFDELQSAMLAAKAAIDRVEWLKNRMIEEVQTAKDAGKKLELFTEKEAAELFGIKEQQMADMRRRHNLPHCSFGKFPRYTKTQLIEICGILEVRPRRAASKASVTRTTLKEAA